MTDVRAAFRTIRYERQEGVATITLDRPQRMNALTPALFDEASAAVDQAVVDGARALILTGAGDAFCSGADLSAEGELPDDLGALLDSHYNPFARKLMGLDIPIVTALNGPAVGAGLGLALLGDIVLAAEESYMLLAFVNIGLVPDAGATWLVAQAVGRARALEMALLGERLAARDAAAVGLVTRVLPREALMEETRAVAQRLAAGPTRAIAMIRKQVNAALASSFEDSLNLERAHQRGAGRTQDFREGVTAFLEKRAPRFQGR